MRHSHPRWVAELLVRGARAGRRARADGGRQPARRGGAARERARGSAPRSSRRSCPWRAAPSTACPSRWCSTAPGTRSARRCGSRARSCRSRAPRWRSRRVLAPAARRARARPVRRAGRQDHAPGGADGGPRAPSWRSSAIPGARRRSRARPRAWGRPRSRCAPPTPRGRRSARPTTACWSTRPARTSARSRHGPTPAGASRPPCPRGWRTSRARSCAPVPTRCGPAARSCTRPARSRPRRTRRSWIASWPSARTSPPTTSARPSGRSGSMDGGPCTCRRSLIETARDGFFIARLRRAGCRVSSDDIDLGDVCPDCGEPWLRPDEPARPLPLRELPAPVRARVRVPELRRALDDRADVEHGAVRLQPLPRVDAGADLSWTGGVAPSILSADFARLGEQVADGARRRARRSIHVDVMDGHFVPPITMGPLVVEAIAEQVHAAGAVVDVHLMIERPERHVQAFADAGRGRDHAARRGDPARALRAGRRARRGLPRRRGAQPRHAARGRLRGRAATWTSCCA